MTDNKKPNFLDAWKRSPRQDRRVVVDGKFVELTEPQHPKPEEHEPYLGTPVAPENHPDNVGTPFEDGEGNHEEVTNDESASTEAHVPVDVQAQEDREIDPSAGSNNGRDRHEEEEFVQPVSDAVPPSAETQEVEIVPPGNVALSQPTEEEALALVVDEASSPYVETPSVPEGE